jgi:uncharacterized protein (TIGR02118 family)
MTVLRVSYKSGVRFDHAYYMSKHLALAGSIMGPHGVKNVEVVKVTSNVDGSPAPYQVIFSAYFDSSAGVQKALQDPRMAEIGADIPKYFDGVPELWIGEVVPL